MSSCHSTSCGLLEQTNKNPKGTGAVRCKPTKLKGLGLPGLALSSAGNSQSGLVYSLLCWMECSEA